MNRSRSSSDPFGDPIINDNYHKPMSGQYNADTSHRAKMVRGQTLASVPVVPFQASAPTGRRSLSQDSVTRAANYMVKARKAGGKAEKKGSLHADVIDRLDYSSVGPMFHHDGPFDACAPSRNRYKNKAPMLSWAQSAQLEPPPATGRSRPERRRMPESLPPNGTHSDRAYADSTGHQVSQRHNTSEHKHVDRMAEAWGIHEPEPYEEFSTSVGSRPTGDTGLASAASSIHGGPEMVSGHSDPARHSGRRDHPRHAGPVKPTKSNANIPPPQPIRLPDTIYPETDVIPNESAEVSGPGPSRSRSLMHRIKKMRDTPNVPLPPDADSDIPANAQYRQWAHDGGSPAVSPGPGHRRNDSLFGRFSRGGGKDELPSPTELQDTEQFVFIRDPPLPRSQRHASRSVDKALPPPPSSAPAYDYRPDGDGKELPYVDGGVAARRRTSLLRKMKEAVRGPRSP